MIKSEINPIGLLQEEIPTKLFQRVVAMRVDCFGHIDAVVKHSRGAIFTTFIYNKRSREWLMSINNKHLRAEIESVERSHWYWKSVELARAACRL